MDVAKAAVTSCAIEERALELEKTGFVDLLHPEATCAESAGYGRYEATAIHPHAPKTEMLALRAIVAVTVMVATMVTDLCDSDSNGDGNGKK